LADAIERPGAQKSWEAIRKAAANNSDIYDNTFATIPANGRSIWPTIAMQDGKRAGGLMPFDNAFWAAPQHSADAAEALKGIEGYLTLLPWRWPVARQGSREILQNTNSGMHSALFTDNGGTSRSQDLQPVRLGAADNKSSEEYPA
jgi:phospholipase D1/2